ncbi:MAG: glycosyltransferase family 4 protein [Muribaculaceae bacterium]|nr:glycosyltransferase family 4 protein [Muribaculaceae bacterium]
MLLHVVPSVRWGGPQRYALDICRYYAGTAGWRVEAVTCDALAVDTLFRQADITLHHAPLGGLTDFSTPVILGRIMADMPQGEPNIVHVHRYRDAFAALVGRHISHRHDVRVIMTRHTVERARDSLLYRSIYPRLDAQIFVSQAALERFMATWRHKRHPIPLERLHVIHNSLFLNDDFRPVPPPSRGPVIAMYHGRLTPGKGLETLIDAMVLLRDTSLRLRIVGSGPPDFVDELRRRALTRGVNDKIDWHRHTPDPMPLIAESHFGVLPSLRREGCGLANIEYMANGRPQISTANGAQGEYLANGFDALLIPVADTQALAGAMRTLATDSALRDRMGRTARATYDSRLAWPLFAEALRHAYTPPR